jgi:hypothetical protein
LVGENGSHPKKRVLAILKAEVYNLKELRSFLGAMNFYRRHCKNFTFSSAPLTELSKKNVKWTWGEEEQKAFEELKSKQNRCHWSSGGTTPIWRNHLGH